MTIRFEDVAHGDGGSSRRHLFGPFWSRVDHVADPTRRLWIWSVERDDTGTTEPVAEGFAYDADDAAFAVEEWARRHRPRSLRARITARLRGN
jgi:hypothetical protein